MPRAKIAMKNPSLPLQSSDVVSAVLRNDTTANVKPEPVKYTLVQPAAANRPQAHKLSQFTLPVIALLITASFGLTALLGANKHEVSAHVAKAENAMATLSMVSKNQTPQAQVQAQNTAAKTASVAVSPVHSQQELFSILNKE